MSAQKIAAKFKNGFHVQVMFKNQISKVDEPKATVQSSQFKDTKPEDITLDKFRTLISTKVDSKWSFSLKNCAPVTKDVLLLDYLALDADNVTIIDGPAPPEAGKAPVETSAIPLLTAYMSVGEAMAPVPTGFGAKWAGEHKPNLTMSDTSKSDIGVVALPASNKANYVAESTWKSSSNPAGDGMLDCVIDFADKDWDKLMMLNKVLYAFDVKGKRLEISSARLAAFDLVLPETQEPQTRPYLHPFVEIRDTPNVDITEVSSEFQSSLVDNAFSAKSLEAMVSGGTPLISASVSAGMKSETSRGSSVNEGGQKKEYHATYNFPRVRLFLDETTLKVSQHCIKALNDLKRDPTLDNLQIFQRRFGVIFAQQVTLGGRLESTKAADSHAAADSSSVKDAFKAELGAAVSYGPVSASASASTENQTSEQKNKSQQQGNSTISYTARGGDTLLCADPPAWASTVAVWRNWRVIQQDEPVTMQELLGRFDEFKWVPEVFNNILQSVPAPKPVVVPVPEKQFDTTKVWTESTKLRLWYGPKKEPSWTFAVRDGSPQNTAAGPRKVLLADYPMFLFKDDALKFPGMDASTVYVNKANGVIGPQTDNKGPYRFSFRKQGATGQWRPLNNLTITNGEKITLWCHSLGIGAWKDLNNDLPSDASKTMYNPTSGELRVNTSQVTFTEMVGYEQAVFNVEFVD